MPRAIDSNSLGTGRGEGILCRDQTGRPRVDSSGEDLIIGAQKKGIPDLEKLGKRPRDGARAWVSYLQPWLQSCLSNQPIETLYQTRTIAIVN